MDDPTQYIHSPQRERAGDAESTAHQMDPKVIELEISCPSHSSLKKINKKI